MQSLAALTRTPMLSLAALIRTPMPSPTLVALFVFVLVILDFVELGYLADATRRSVYQGERIRKFQIVGLTGCSLNVVLLPFMCATFLFTFRDERCHMFLDTIWTL